MTDNKLCIDCKWCSANQELPKKSFWQKIGLFKYDDPYWWERKYPEDSYCLNPLVTEIPTEPSLVVGKLPPHYRRVTCWNARFPEDKCGREADAFEPK
jgi:hypothetical protein